MASTSRHLPLLRPRPSEHPATQPPVGNPANLQSALVGDIRLFQQQNSATPWHQLASKYCLSTDTLQSIYNQAEVEAQRRQQQSALVTKTAERYFDSAIGQYDWEAIASELDIPLIECLDHFCALTIQPRSLIETFGGWSRTDVEELKRFIAANYTDDSTVDWKLAGIYMNVDALECQHVVQGTFHGPINKVGYRLICELRDSNMIWKDIYQHFMQYRSVNSLTSRYYRFKAKPNGNTTKGLTTAWTDDERNRMKILIEQHMESTTRLELVSILKRELPARPLCDIGIFSCRYVCELKAGRMHTGQMIRLRELVAEYGEDWGRIGEALGVLPSSAQYNWVKYGGKVGGNSGWTLNEACSIRNLIDSGVNPKAGQVLGVGSLQSCQGNMPDAESSAEDEILLNMVDGPGINSAAWWEQVGMAIGRTESACKSRFKLITRKRKQVTNDREILVTSEVQRQRESSGVVDWSQVSQATGLSMHECLELSQYDVGKTSWDYGPDSFSHNMVDCMTSFIEEYYPAPVSVNYRAVSNFMWVAMGDCIRIHDETRDRFGWTKADFERAAVLRAQGLTFKEVARQLSPALTQDNVFNALKNYTSHKQVLEPISVGESSEIVRLVDEYAGNYTVAEIVDRIRTQLSIGDRHDCYSLIATRIAVHPHYQAKLRDIDYNDLASRISTGQTTVKHAAKELDVPHAALNGYLRSLYKKQFPLSWTEEETRKLVDYMKSCDLRPDFVYFSKVLGTKSASQCSSKAFSLRRMGVLPLLRIVNNQYSR
ncbi:hypothetical protein GGI01_000397 [Coemansia sp. RSA 376]|nr:hypothetical protein GGI01_000397 [Coemansia sp. RSA 376]